MVTLKESILGSMGMGDAVEWQDSLIKLLTSLKPVIEDLGYWKISEEKKYKKTEYKGDYTYYIWYDYTQKTPKTYKSKDMTKILKDTCKNSGYDESIFVWEAKDVLHKKDTTNYVSATIGFGKPLKFYIKLHLNYIDENGTILPDNKDLNGFLNVIVKICDRKFGKQDSDKMEDKIFDIFDLG